MGAVVYITERQLALSPLPEFEVRASQSVSPSVTSPVRAKTFDRLEHWENFTRDANEVINLLDNTRASIIPPVEYYKSSYLDGCFKQAADEVTFRGALETHLFPLVNRLAASLSLRLYYATGGGGRTESFADMAILNRDIPQEPANPPQAHANSPQSGRRRMALSRRVFGDGEAKGYWQFDVEEGEDTIASSLKGEKFIHVVQQLYGYMVQDEAGYGFLSNYHKTLFFKRDPNPRNKTLFMSPIIHIKETPLKYYLFFLHEVSNNQAVKPMLKKELVPNTPPGQRLTLPTSTSTTNSGRRGAADEEASLGLPFYDLSYMGLTSIVIGGGTHSVVLEAVNQGLPLAVKVYNLKKEGAYEKFCREKQAYDSLKPVQGVFVPKVVGVGVMTHIHNAFIAMMDGGVPIDQTTTTREVSLVLHIGLQAIHSCGVVHGDLHCRNMLLRDSQPRFIGFGESTVFPEKGPLFEELAKEDMEQFHEAIEGALVS